MDVLGLDAEGAELRVGDRVKHDFGRKGTIAGITLATPSSGLLDKYNINWDGSLSDAPASTASSQHVRKNGSHQRFAQPVWMAHCS